MAQSGSAYPTLPHPSRITTCRMYRLLAYIMSCLTVWMTQVPTLTWYSTVSKHRISPMMCLCLPPLLRVIALRLGRRETTVAKLNFPDDFLDAAGFLSTFHPTRAKGFLIDVESVTTALPKTTGRINEACFFRALRLRRLSHLLSQKGGESVKVYQASISMAGTNFWEKKVLQVFKVTGI